MQAKEIWKDIPGYEGKYKISNLGNVLTFYRSIWKKKATFVTDVGYIYVSLEYKGKKRKCGVHILVAESFVEGWFEGAEVNHKDLNKLNNRWDNLEWVTHSENLIHQYKMYHLDYKKSICCICGKEITNGHNFCAKCYGKSVRDWPSYEYLFEKLKYMNYKEIGKECGKSDNGIRRVCKVYGLPCNSKDLKQFRIDNNCYVPTQSELRKTKEERYVHYEINGEKKTAQGWSLYLGLEGKRIGRYANKHSYEETIEYIKSFM